MTRRARGPALRDRLIVALDTADLREALRLTKRLQGLIRYVKIGSALFTAEGPEAIRRMRALGLEVFLDLKFHDIPSTVEKSCRAAVRHRVAMLTVHASGPRPMLDAAVAGVRDESKRLGIRRPRVVGVTVLTSVGGVASKAIASRVAQLAGVSHRAGLDGVVASAHEVPLIRRRFGSSLLVVCPGIRPLGTEASDQHRIASPRAAIRAGADCVVVGRPIAQADDPRATTVGILAEIAEGLRDRR